MSLIDEALKRARLDAARQDAARQAGGGAGGQGSQGGAAGQRGGFASPWAHMPASRARRYHPRRVAMAAAMVLSLLIGAAGIVLFLRTPLRTSLRSSERAGAGAAGDNLAAVSPANRSAAAVPALGAPRPAPGGDSQQAGAGAGTGAEAAAGGEAEAGAGGPANAAAPAAATMAGRAAWPATAPATAAPAATAANARTAAAEDAASSRGGKRLPSPRAGEDRTTVGNGGTGQAGGGAGPEPPRGAGTPPAGASPAAATSGASAGTAAGASAGTVAGASAGAAVRTMADGGTYLGEVKLADGGTVKLSGIAWSDTSPVAVINGKLIGPGQGVDQVTVDKIEPDRVTLHHSSGALFYLRLK